MNDCEALGDYFSRELQEQSYNDDWDIDWDDESQGVEIGAESYDP